MATLYDEQGTEIYAGRGKYSRNARTKIAERAAYVRNDEGNLVVYVPENENEEAPRTQRASTLDEDARALKRRAQRLGRQLGLGFDELEIRRNTPEGTLVAHLKQLTPAILAGLDSDQAAKLVQTFTYWMLRQDLNVHEHEDVVRNLHELINPMRVPSNGASVLNRDAQQSRDDAVNVYPAPRTRAVHNELWIHAFLPPMDHPCRPSVTPLTEGESAAGEHNLRNDGRVWYEPALIAGPDFVCDNLQRVAGMVPFRRGRHGIIRIFLPYNPTLRFNGMNNLQRNEYDHRDRRCLPEEAIDPENEPWSDCLQRFINACVDVKRRARSDLRLLIHRGSDTPMEVIL